MSNEVEVIIAGAEGSYTCITAAERPFASHCWIRAASHIRDMKGFNYFERMEAATVCEAIANVVAREKKKPQRIEPVPRFSWSSFKTIKPIS